MPRAQINLGGPLVREQEGVRLTERSLSARLAEIAERLGRLTEAAQPHMTHEEWTLVSWAGWDAIEAERIVSRHRPQDIDGLAWMSMVASVAESDAQCAAALAKRLHEMNPVERVAVLERIEAYGRAEAMR